MYYRRTRALGYIECEEKAEYLALTMDHVGLPFYYFFGYFISVREWHTRAGIYPSERRCADEGLILSLFIAFASMAFGSTQTPILRDTLKPVTQRRYYAKKKPTHQCLDEMIDAVL